MCNQGIREFIINTINDYNRSVRVTEYVENIPVQDRGEHPGFDQIGVRYRLEENIFDPNSNVYPGVIGLTDVITLGEQAYFVKKLMSDNNTPNFEIKRNKFTPQYFEGIIGNWDAVALFPVDIFYEDLHMLKQENREWLQRINYPDKNARFNKIYPLYPISQKLIKEIDHKIILYHKMFTKWNYVEYINEFFNTPQRLKIDIERPLEGHRLVTLKTVNRLEYNSEYVKIINIIE